MLTLLLFIVLLFIGMPIVFLLAFTTLAFLVEYDLYVLLDSVPLNLFNSVDKNGLLAIPMFMLVGELMNRGGITDKLVAVAALLVGRMRGGLAYVNLLTNMLASAILGSATAQIALMTRTMVPSMVEHKYDKSFATAVSISGGLLGPVIPPSMLMIIYGIVSYQSVAALFIAGILPGLLLAFGFALVIMVTALRGGLPRGEAIGGKHAMVLFEGLLPTVIPAIIIIGVVSGIMTPTESGAIASLSAFILGFFIYRRIKLRDLPGIFLQVALSTAMVVSLVGLATLLGWALAFEGIPDMLAEGLQQISDSPWVFLLLLNLLILFLGMFLDGIGVMIIIVPIMLPVAQSFGIDPIHFGVIIAISTLLGLVTPPVGPGLYIAMETTGLRMGQLFKSVLPFLLAMIVGLVIINAFPSLSVWLPAYLGLS